MSRRAEITTAHGSRCPSCGSRQRRYDADALTTFCMGCGREFEPYALGDDELDPLADARDHDVVCPECGRRFVLRAFYEPTAERIVQACGHAVGGGAGRRR